jgi:hypothetical protein
MSQYPCYSVDFLGILLIDQFHHSGQIAYLRGYLTGKGWFPR